VNPKVVIVDLVVALVVGYLTAKVEAFVRANPIR
jgi:hypothetical protein